MRPLKLKALDRKQILQVLLRICSKYGAHPLFFSSQESAHFVQKHRKLRINIFYDPFEIIQKQNQETSIFNNPAKEPHDMKSS